MSDKDRQKKDHKRKDKENKATREQSDTRPQEASAMDPPGDKSNSAQNAARSEK
jgi:hypothetical protein